MKKLKLKALELGATEVLTRDQLKNVLGGYGSTGCGANGTCSGTCIEPGMTCGYEPSDGTCMCDYY